MPVVHFNDWSKGDWGDMDRRTAGKEPGYFEGLNVKVYSDGLIGPRPGLRKVATDGWTTNGVVRGLFFTASTGEELVMTVEGQTRAQMGVVTTGSQILDTITWAPSTGTAFTAAPTDWTSFDRYDPTTIYIGNPDDGVYELVVTGAIPMTKITLPATSGQGYIIRLWRDRLYIGSHDNDSEKQRIWYSDAGDLNTVGASNYFDVGYWWPIWSMTPIRNGLLIGTQGAGWWVLTGSPATGTLRQVYTRGEPDRQPSLVVDDMERCWYLPQNERPLAVTNGSTWDFDTHEHLFLPGTVHHGDYSYGNRDVMFLTTDGSDKALSMHNDVWVKSTFSVNLSGPLTRYSADYFLLVGGDSASTAADFYWYDNSLERPGFAGDATARPGDNTDTPVNATLNSPEFIEPSGSMIRVRSVTFDFVKYNTASTSPATNNITCTVRSTGIYQTAGDIDSTAISWTEAVASASTTGTACRYTMEYHTPWAGGFQIRLSALRGVKIKDITVEYELEHPKKALRPGAHSSSPLV